MASTSQMSNIRDSRFSHICRINTDKLKMIRTKFNVWDAIGFIGGTHDGIYLIVGILLRPISACLFQIDLVKDSMIDTGQTKK